MKFTLMVLASFVGLSCQERYIWPMPFVPRAHLMPLFYADGKQAGFERVIDTYAPAISQKNAGEEKLLLNNFTLPSLPSLPSLSSLINLHPFTTTVISTVVQTVSTPYSAKCIPSAQLANTTACSRRRRDLDSLVALGESESIVPNEPIALEVTAVEPKAVNADAIPEIESSQATEIHQNNENIQRNFAGLSLTSTVVSMTTVFSFVPYTVKVTATVATSGGLLCLPSGYLVC